MAKSTIDILEIIDKHGLPAAVKAIVRVYENAPQDNPHSAFWAPFANACVHTARWTLGHDSKGKARFEPKLVTDPRFKRLVSGLVPPGGAVEDLVIEIGESCAHELSRILHMDEVSQDEVSVEAYEDALHMRSDAEHRLFDKYNDCIAQDDYDDTFTAPSEFPDLD